MKKHLFFFLTFISTNAFAEAEMNTYTHFLDDSRMDLSFRNYWNYLKDNQSGDKTVSSAWGQGAALNY